MTVAALLPLAIQLGCWVLERLVRTGARALAYYLEGKAEDFDRRATHRCNHRRRAWLSERAQAWRHAAAAIRGRRISDAAASAALAAARQAGTPEVAPGERYKRWRRLAAPAATHHRSDAEQS